MYEYVWRGKGLLNGCKTISEMQDRLVEELALLDRMLKRGLVLEGEIKDDWGYILCDDETIAREFGIEDSEYDDDNWDDEDDDWDDEDDFDDWDDDDDFDWENDYNDEEYINDDLD